MQVTPAEDKLLLAYVTYDEVAKTESLLVEECGKNLSEKDCTTPVVISTGPFTFNPRLHRDGTDRWLSWCEAPTLDQKFYTSRIRIQKIWPQKEDIRDLSDDEGFNCGQSVQIKNGMIHVVYEKATSKGMSLYYKKGPDKIVIAKDTLVRRPSLALMGDSAVIAYDRWSSRNRGLDPVAPDYDIEIAFVANNKVRTEKFESTRGLEQAPSLWFENGELYLAYHRGPQILKHWEIRKWDGKAWLMPNLFKPFRNDNATAENQGAEFPQIMGLHKGSPVLTSRPSHSAFVHSFNGNQVETIDLDQDGWGARDMWMSGFIEGEDLFLARRGFKSVVLEKIRLPEKPEALKWIPAKIPLDEKVSSDLPIRYKKYPGVKFGDVHMHSAYSDGAGAPDEIYARAYARRLDFAALTDHDTIVASRLFPSQYFEIMMLTDLFDALPGMTAIQAFEWTTPPIPLGSGHKNVYFKGRAPVPVYNAKHVHSDTPKLYKALKGQADREEVFTAPHHTGWTGTDWEHADPKIQRHFEVASVHGVFEDSTDNPLQEHSRPAAIPEVKGGYARDGFKLGKKFGLIAGSDAHGLKSHHGHGRHDNPWTQGLTGVYTHSERREDVFKAMYDQKTFATTGPFSYVKTWIKKPRGHHHVDMKKVIFHYDVEATTSIRELTLVWNGVVVWKKGIGGAFKVSGRIPLKEVPEQKSEHHSLYLRAVQDSEHQINLQVKDQVDIVFSGPLFL